MPKPQAFTKEERKEIAKELDRGVPATVIARERGVHPQTVRNTRQRNYADERRKGKAS